ncbi:DEAD/DEAH box helicase [Paraburkholderia sp. UCT31]|uniref:DEAD/DEAH box helicase n=1 Tax=Paraburkholderia sp. UCT31 TaxID=2615209 RepID=UPI001655C918|nr:DEAD/DEAH box helicase [Paraburkholderia sp. UCT31]MBC8739823.1 DEAD/DEAH box helicase [Paraburkholderia sp. UCT31]
MLDHRIQRWIWQKGWTELRDAQERAIPPILEAKNDVIIAASTASGKTEAAFMPILSRLLALEPEQGVVLYISPLKALINDQWGRLDQLCEELEIPVVPWHGDVAATKKQRFVKQPAGCVLITPESLEAILYNKGHSVTRLFAQLQYIVIDELHSFMGIERGKQLQSLMNRLEVALQRTVPRIGLSATLGDIRLAAEFLRPGAGDAVTLIESKESSGALKILVKGYLDLPPVLNDAEIAARERDGEELSFTDTTGVGQLAIARHLYDNLRGTNNLIFPNSRNAVEKYAAMLRSLSEADGVPTEFWPHHGNLSKEIREETERALKQSERPATAIATSTLEMGIDIGTVETVAQIGPGPSVGSLRQRLGRSGRREGAAAVLRGYAIEPDIDPHSPIADTLRESLVQLVAQVQLLLQGWFEPPRAAGMHLSTLIQQLLSAIGQYGGISFKQAYALLCERGPFRAVSMQDFALLLRSLGTQGILLQDSGGALLHGPAGEAIANHYSFYAAFSSPEEYRLVAHGRVLGSLPITSPVGVGDYLLFGGRRWKVERVDLKDKVVEVHAARGGRAPAFGGESGAVHTRVRQEMRAILKDDRPIGYLDPKAKELLAGARAAFRSADLGVTQRLVAGKDIKLFLWQGDEIQNTLALLLKSRGIAAQSQGLVIAIENCEEAQLDEALTQLAGTPELAPEALLAEAENLVVEKWDMLVPSPLRERNYASLYLDLPGAYRLLRTWSPQQPKPPA